MTQKRPIPIPPSRPALAATFAATVAAACAAVLPAQAADLPPPMRVRVVGDVDGNVLAMLREQAQNDVRMCRFSLGQPDGTPPPLPDDQLRKIVYYESTRLYRPDRIAEYTIERTVFADPQSGCKPYVWVTRSASLSIGCESTVSGVGEIAPNVFTPGWQPPPSGRGTVEVKPHRGACGHVGNARPPALKTVDAGGGVPCMWHSAVIGAALGPLARRPVGDGATPSPGGDVCVYARRPAYESPLIVGANIELKSYRPVPAPGSAGGHERAESYLTLNNHLAELDEKAVLPDAQFTKEAVQAFVNQPYREAMPPEK